LAKSAHFSRFQTCSTGFNSGDAGEVDGLPAADGVFVAFTGAAFGFLRSPGESLAEEPPDVVVMEAAFEVLRDDVCDAGGGPEVVGPAVGARPFHEKLFEPLELGVGEVRRPVRMGLGGEAVGLLGGLSPAIQ
jgi:hypothetical protein